MHTVVLRARREKFAAETVIGLYDVVEKKLYEFDSFTLDGQRKRLLTIGRARYCDIKPLDTTVSQVHCNILRKPDGSFELEDAGSTNGLLANDIQVASIVLSPGMWIFVGQTEFVVVGPDRKIPIRATTTSSFLAKAARVYGSARKAADKVNKSRETIRRAKNSKNGDKNER